MSKYRITSDTILQAVASVVFQSFLFLFTVMFFFKRGKIIFKPTTPLRLSYKYIKMTFVIIVCSVFVSK